MSSAPQPRPPDPSDPAAELETLRAELDRLDDALHDTLMRRAEVVARVAALNAKGRVALRPGREAAIIRRLLERNHGDLPARALPRIWRELFAATTGMQGPFRIAVCDPAPAQPAAAIAREHFGALTPMHIHPTPGQALREVQAGTASAAILPVPREEEPEPWWPGLMQHDGARPHVVARLPFWARRPEGAPAAETLVVTLAPPDPSGHDRSLIGLELAPDLSRARLGSALTAAGLPPHAVIIRRDPQGGARALVEVPGFVAVEDPCLAAIAAVVPRRPVVLGAYAVPVEE